MTANKRRTMTVVQQQPQSTSNSNNGGGPSGPSAQPSTNVPTSALPAQPQTIQPFPIAQTNGKGVMAASTSASTSSGPSKGPLPAPLSKMTPKPSTAVFSHPLSPNHSSGSDTDPVLTTAAAAATALRRLYFKSGRSCRPKGPTVPMVRLNGSLVFRVMFTLSFSVLSIYSRSS